MVERIAERYIFGQAGIVEGIFLPGKAILTFMLHDQSQRALLWVKGFVYQGKNLEQSDSFYGKLNVGDHVCFDCHVYDRQESKDNCGWYAPKAWKDVPGETPAPTPPRIMNQTGYIFELDPGKGVILFELNGEVNYVDQRVIFLRSKFYQFGKRVGNKHALSEYLSENDPVQFDAEQCDPTLENKKCNWLASLVWKGKKPIGASPWQVATATYHGVDDISPEDSQSNADLIEEESDFPALSLPPGLTDRQGYKAFEASPSTREGKGNVVALLNEECGIALWMVKQNVWETVFFHRRGAFLVDEPLGKYDIQESLVVGTLLDITAVLAVQDFPCKWIAHKVVVSC